MKDKALVPRQSGSQIQKENVPHPRADADKNPLSFSHCSSDTSKNSLSCRFEDVRLLTLRAPFSPDPAASTLLPLPKSAPQRAVAASSLPPTCDRQPQRRQGTGDTLRTDTGRGSLGPACSVAVFSKGPGQGQRTGKKLRHSVRTVAPRIREQCWARGTRRHRGKAILRDERNFQKQTVRFWCSARHFLPTNAAWDPPTRPWDPQVEACTLRVNVRTRPSPFP